MVTIPRLAVLALIALIIAAFFLLDVHHHLTLETLQQQQQSLRHLIGQHPLTAAALYFTVYLILAAFSLPGATLMTLAGGALFGLGWGLVLVSFASSVGATLALLVSRYLFRETVRRRYPAMLDRVDKGVERDGGFYLASIRLVPMIPFFVTNLVMGLTRIRLWTYYWVSQLAMLPATLVYVNAGTRLAALESVNDILSPAVLGSLTLLALFPLLAPVLVRLLQRKQVYAGWRRPQRYDYNLLVIGAGSGGLVSAYIAAAVRARVGLIESGPMGGDCLNTGCVPSKALIRTSRLAQQFREADRFGLTPGEPTIDFGTVMDRVSTTISRIAPHDSPERYRQLGVDCIPGRARFVDPWTLSVTDARGHHRRLTARSIVIATGARPLLPPLEGLDSVSPLTSDNLWQLRQLPARLLVLGGGPVGCELAQAFARLGSRVTQIERGERLLSKEDPEASAAVLTAFQREGIDVRLGHEARRFAIEGDDKVLYADHGGETVRVAFDQVLVALGRQPRVDDLNLEGIGLRPGPGGNLEAAEDMSLRLPHIFACGDVAGPYQFTHNASNQAWFAAVNGLFGRFKRFRVDYRCLSWVTFTSPEVGRLGLSETEARARKIPYEVTHYPLEELDRAIVDSETGGFIKVLTVPGKDRILGALVVGEHAEAMLAELALAMKQGIGLNRILGTVHPYPTWNEAVKATAGQWRQAHAPQLVLRWLERYHRFWL